MITSQVQRFDAATLEAWTGPAARAQILSDAAEAILKETDAINEAALGGKPTSVTTVDGSATSDITLVRPEGAIDRIYDVMPAVLKQIDDWLFAHSPVRTGRYQHSHYMFVDGVQMDPGEVIPAGAKEIVFMDSAAYAQVIEPHDGKPGESKQAPDGVYQVIAAMAQQQFGQLADISFGFMQFPFIDLRQPAIIVLPLRGT